jgi:hypothetical protein
VALPFSSTCWHFGFVDVVVVVVEVGFVSAFCGLGEDAKAIEAASPATNSTARSTLSFIGCLQVGVLGI